MPDLGLPQHRIDTEVYTNTQFNDSGVDSNAKWNVSAPSVVGGTPAKVGSFSASFDGSKAEVSRDVVRLAGGIPMPAQGQPFTIEMWAYSPLTDTDTYTLCGSGNNNNNSYTSIRVTPTNGRVYWDRGGYIDGTFVNKVFFSADGTFLPNAWNHIALVFDQVEIRLYVNGVLGGSLADTYGWPDSLTMGFAVGAISVYSRKEQFDGLLDEFAIYHYARYTEDFNPDNPFPPPPPPGTRNIWAGDAVSPNQGQCLALGTNFGTFRSCGTIRSTQG